MKGRARGDKEGRRARRSREVETRDANLDRRGLICAGGGGADELCSERRCSISLGSAGPICLLLRLTGFGTCRTAAGSSQAPLGSSQGNGIPLINPDKKPPQVLL